MTEQPPPPDPTADYRAPEPTPPVPAAEPWTPPEHYAPTPYTPTVYTPPVYTPPVSPYAQPSTAVPPTDVPPTDVPPTDVPATAMPAGYGPSTEYTPMQYAPTQPPYGQPPSGYGTPPKKSHALGWTLGILGAIVVLGLACGGVFLIVHRFGTGVSGATAVTTPATAEPIGPPPTGTTSTGSPAAVLTQQMPIGATLALTDDSGNVMTVKVNKITYRTTGCGTNDFGISSPEAGDAYIVIDVTYTVTKGVGSYNPFDWSVTDTVGTSSDDLGLFADCQPELNSSNSLRGTVRGLVVIEVPKGDTHGQVVYSIDFGDSSGSWAF